MTAALFLWGFAFLGAQEPEQKAPPAAIGSEMCQLCHEDIHKSFQRNPHNVVETDARHRWVGQACESCHGPGSAHMESMSAADIRNPAKIPAAEADRLCLTCHLNQHTQVGRIQGGHARNQVSCVECHPVHQPVDRESMVARRTVRVNQQCAGCHPAEWAQFHKPHAHRLPQGAMSCVDCHNPHGSFLARSVQTVSGNEPGCFQCHGDKRGPFVFEHAPMRLEGCASCHQPHGSANPRMLVRQEVHQLCLECHANLSMSVTPGESGLGGVPPAFHDLRSPRFRNCTICHVKVHGSHVNRALLR